MIEQIEDRGVEIKVADLFIAYLLRDGVCFISSGEGDIYNALRCSYCSQNHLIDDKSPFVCNRCGSPDYERLQQW